MNLYDDIHYNNRNALVLEHKDFLSDKAFLEFGVYEGTSMLMWHGLYIANGLATSFFGFDSFQGIPLEKEDLNNIPNWGVGAFNTNGRIHERLLRIDAQLIIGFFSDSLHDVAANKLMGQKAGIVHFDCDTCSSTKTVWEWLLRYDLLVPGTLLVYDDWGGYLEAKCGEYEVGEAKAHKDMVAKHGLQLKDLGKYIVDPAFYEVKIYQYESRT